MSSPSSKTENDPSRPAIVRSASYVGIPTPPVTAPSLQATETKNNLDAVIELSDGTVFGGISFGAEGKSVAGECVFQTGMNHFSRRSFLRVKNSRRYGGLYRVFDRSIIRGPDPHPHLPPRRKLRRPRAARLPRPRRPPRTL